jgi:rRNA processing protein Gar1
MRELKPVGVVMARIDAERTVVVQGNTTSMPLNVGALLCSEGGVVLGRVQDVFGPVTEPFYSLQWALTDVVNAGSVSGDENRGGGGEDVDGHKQSDGDGDGAGDGDCDGNGDGVVVERLSSEPQQPLPTSLDDVDPDGSFAQGGRVFAPLDESSTFTLSPAMIIGMKSQKGCVRFTYMLYYNHPHQNLPLHRQSHIYCYKLQYQLTPALLDSL